MRFTDQAFQQPSHCRKQIVDLRQLRVVNFWHGFVEVRALRDGRLWIREGRTMREALRALRDATNPFKRIAA